MTAQKAGSQTAMASILLSSPLQLRWTDTSNSPSIPLFYRLTVLYIEPLFAIYGAFLLLTQPSVFLSFVSPHAADPDAFSSLGILIEQLAAFELLFAFNNGVLLQLCREEKVWRIVCLGQLMTDALHIGISVQGVGWEVAMAPVTRWRSEEWVNFGIMGWMLVVRLGIVLRIGMGSDNVKRSFHSVNEKTDMLEEPQ